MFGYNDLSPYDGSTPYLFIGTQDPIEDIRLFRIFIRDLKTQLGLESFSLGYINKNLSAVYSVNSSELHLTHYFQNIDDPNSSETNCETKRFFSNGAFQDFNKTRILFINKESAPSCVSMLPRDEALRLEEKVIV